MVNWLVEKRTEKKPPTKQKTLIKPQGKHYEVHLLKCLEVKHVGYSSTTWELLELYSHTVGPKRSTRARVLLQRDSTEKELKQELKQRENNRGKT